ncbi:MAG: PQQ-like beta-propeller repeat protein [Planctomycetales bacterium]|nr:PQQ-like beta-propeller repeat protein [Planctomycetales bacterium]
MQSVALYRALPSMLLLSALCGLGKCQAANWPLSRADAAGTGATTEELPADLDLLWEYKLEGIGFESGPIVVDGIVYACDYDGRVVAVELETGKEKWKLELDTVFVASPAYDQGVLYVGDYEGKFRALDASTGKEKWMFDASLQIDAGANFYRDTLLVTSEEGTLYCLNKLDGQLVWKYETGNQLQCSATLAGRITYLGGCDEHLHIVDVESGKAISEPVSISAPTGSTPSVMDNTIFVPTYAGEILAFPAGEVQPRWRFNDESLGGEFKNSVAVANGKVVASS